MEDKKNTQRSFSLGEEWLYFKVYTGVNTSEVILTSLYKSAVEKLLDLNLIDKWFFIRYNDPEFHIRLRLHLTEPFNFNEVFKHLTPLFKVFIDEGLIWEIKTSIYEREIERYGSQSMEISEDLFHKESDLIVKFLSKSQEGYFEDIDSRWLFGLMCIDCYMDAFKFDLDSKINFLERLNYNFVRDYNINSDKDLKKQISLKYRQKSVKIDKVLTDHTIGDFELRKFLDLHKDTLIKINEKLSELEDRNLLGKRLEILIISYLHMLLNRLFKFNSNLNEMMCYHFLLKYYRSKRAQNKANI